MTETLGPTTREQLRRLSREWKQGEHVAVSGGTGSGKTSLGRHLDQIRIDRGGFVVMLVCKLQRDKTIETDYKGWTRWDFTNTRDVIRKLKNPSPSENKVLLWPDTTKAKSIRDKRDLQSDIFRSAFDTLADIGKWTLDVDEGLYICDPRFMRLDAEIAMLHALGRSSDLTIITKMQRPANVPLIVYGSASHAFVNRTREASDLKRLAEMGGKESAKNLQARISAQGRHDFLWLPIAPDWEPETVNIRH